MKITCHGIEADRPNNGIVYPKEVLEKAIKEAQEAVSNGKMMVHCGDGTIADTGKIVGVARGLELVDGKVEANIDVIDAPLSDIIQKGLVSYFPRGVGSVDDGRTSDFKLTSIGISLKNKSTTKDGGDDAKI